MTIPESVRLSILELHGDGVSVREIASRLGVGKNTVSRVIAKGGNVPDLGDTVPTVPISPQPVPKTSKTHARATKSEQPPDVSPKPKVTVIEARTITRDLTISELYNLLQSAKRDLEIARRNNDGTRDSIVATATATKAVTEILKQMGKWCGLDDTLTGEPEKQSIGKDDVGSMSLDEMRELVSRL